MAIRLDYLARETGQNLVRNLLLTVATMLIVTVSLTMLGVTILLGYYGLNNAFVAYNQDVSFIVYMEPTASQDQINALARDLKRSPQVDDYDYYDQKKSFELFKKMFQGTEEVSGLLTQSDMPPSFRVKPKNADAAVVTVLARSYSPKPGVMKVDFPAEAIKPVQAAALQLRTWLVMGVIVLLAASIVLIFIAIQTAVFSRRREIEVMRLVGATNWFIRIPFIVEGVIEGLVGGLLATGFAALLGVGWKGSKGTLDNTLLTKFTWTAGQQTSTSLLLIGLGVVVGALGSFVATLWYLRD
ncbi:MAG: permease-like cell division protein FtsX [Microthrixaceae bacterium]